MKKILFLAMAAAALVSCSQNEEFENAGKQEEIKFKTIVNASTKVAPMITDNFVTFFVNAYNTQAVDMGTGASLTKAFMTNVTAKKEKGVWTIDQGPFYWPMTDKIQFFAYSPIGTVKGYTATTGYPSFTYEIPVVASQEDLLVAKAENATKTANKDGVELNFAHILTQVNFSAELEAGITYDVTEIKIVGVNNSGTFTYGAATNVGAWTAQAGSATYIYDANYSATATNNVVDYSTADNALMLLPQSIPADAKIQVTYKATASDGTVTYQGTKDVPFSGTWDMAKKIRYTLKLSSDATAVVLVPKVDAWTNTEDAGTTKDNTTPAAN